MKEIKITIPEYDNGVKCIWDDNYKIKTSAPFDSLTIEANREGLISLARHLLHLAQDDVPDGCHIHLDEYIALEDGSLELIISKNEKL